MKPSVADSRTRFHLHEAARRSLRTRGPRASVLAGYRYIAAKWQLRRVDRLGAVRVIGTVRVRKSNGRISVGDRVLMEGTIVPIELSAWSADLTIGDGTYINYGTNISARVGVTIGNNVAIGQYSIIMDDDYHSALDHRKRGKSAPITIQDDAWLGARVIVLRGSHIGQGAVIGANSVVTGVIPPRTVAVGSPARVVKSLDTFDDD